MKKLIRFLNIDLICVIQAAGVVCLNIIRQVVRMFFPMNTVFELLLGIKKNFDIGDDW